MSKPLILVRHSLPEIQPDRPAREWKLSAEGRRRAQLLSERLCSYSVQLVFSSFEPKAIETAQIIAATCGAQLRTVEGLHEHDRSSVSYLSRQEFEAAIRLFFRHPDTLVFGRETANQARERFSGAVHSIRAGQDDPTILIVAHGTVISLFVAQLTGASAFSLWKRLGLPSFVVADVHVKRVITIENLA